jgi:hypothetical protein
VILPQKIRDKVKLLLKGFKTKKMIGTRPQIFMVVLTKSGKGKKLIIG